MARKQISWLKRKATKSPEEWQRINRIYDQRRRLRNSLKIRGAELLDKIHNYRLVQSPGPADALIDEVHKVLRLPYCWNQEDFDHAEARLSDIDKNLTKIKQRITPKTTGLANIILMIIIYAGETEDVKASALISAVEYMANQLSVEKIESFENSKTNYIMTLLRTKDTYYPEWIVKFLYNNILQLLTEVDVEKLTKMLMKVVISFKNRDSIANMMEVEKEDEREIK